MFLDKLLKPNLSDTIPEYVRQKVYLSNQIALFVTIIVGIPITTVSSIYFPPIIYITVLGMLVCLIAIGMTWLGIIHISRFIVSVVPYFLCLTYCASLMKVGEEPVAAVYLCSLSFSLVAFLVFDFREKYFLSASALIMFLSYMFIDEINALFEVDVDADLMRHGFLAVLVTGISVIMAWAGVWVMAFFNQKANKKSEELINKMADQYDHIKNSEEQLKLNIQEIEKVKDDEKKRTWVNEGLNKFSDILRADEDVKKKYDKLISEAVTYLNANQGGLYVTDENEKEGITIKLEASYAYERKKFQQKIIKPGQGLLGQAYLEGETLLLKTIPNNYTTITSGMGESTPNRIIIVPLKVNESVEALLELASFSEFEDFHIRFLEKLGESIASSVSTMKTDQKTRTLLEQSRIQTEDIRSQEEEMRQNLEELQSTQEEMARKEKEYINRINELESQL